MDDKRIEEILSEHENLCENQTKACGDCRRLQRSVKQLVREAGNRGHWFVKYVSPNESGETIYSCYCGYETTTRDALDSHIDWKKAELTPLHRPEASKGENDG